MQGAKQGGPGGLWVNPPLQDSSWSQAPGHVPGGAHQAPFTLSCPQDLGTSFFFCFKPPEAAETASASSLSVLSISPREVLSLAHGPGAEEWAGRGWVSGW